MARPLDPKEFRRALEEVPEALFEILTRGLADYGKDFALGTMRREARSNLAVRSALLAGSFDSNTEGETMDSWRMFVFSTNRYARYQEEGGFTEPAGRYLTIPLPAALTGGGRGAGGGAGVTRGNARAWSRETTFVAESKKGNVLIFRKTGRRRPPGWREGEADPSIEPLFLLVERSPRSGRMPGRLGFFEAWEREDPERRQIMGDSATAALETIGQ